MLAGCHRHGASYQARNTRDQNIVLCRRSHGNAHDQTRGRDYAVICAEHRSSQPSNAVNEVMLRVKVETAHAVAIRVSLRSRGDRGCPVLSRAYPTIVHRLSIEHLSPRKHSGDDAASFAKLGHDHSDDMDGDQEKQCVEVPVMRRDKG